MKLARVALALALLSSTACGEDTVRDVEVTVGTARVAARMDAPDELATLDLTANLEPTVDMEGATITDVVLRRLPDGPELEFDFVVRGPQDTATIDLAAGDIAVARITNAATTNAEVLPFCNAAASVTVSVEVEGLEREASRDLTVGCS
jgi:hypothetical protein